MEKNDIANAIKEDEDKRNNINKEFKKLLVDTGVLQKDLAKHLSYFQTMLSKQLNDELDMEEKVEISNEINYLSFLKFLLLEEYDFRAFEEYSRRLNTMFYESDIQPVIEEYNINLETIDPIFEHITGSNIDDIDMFNEDIREELLRKIAYKKYLLNDKKASKRKCEIFKMQYMLFLESEKCEKNSNIKKEYIDIHAPSYEIF